MNGRTSKRQSAGFTLIELMIVLAIVAVLAGWGVPSYREHVARVHRASAVSALYRAAQYLETLDGAPPSALPGALARAPPDGQVVYRLALRRPANDDSPVTYKLEASPLDTGPMRDDVCGTFTLRSDGTKGNDRRNADEQDAACWGVR
ncbi:pilus assembly protein PilE [Burkholderia stabilis]|uniref:Serogroup C1,putative major pilin subunit,Tfp pilus assembly protein PilE,prepilin-type N-terminal cleavage/methylation domain n=1 Tax=Burkholderia stabilis TaxID=95485 RepID=A0AAJ5N943_9BURK|nr:type IV pilin protein [Burkholderia stabilis]AOR67521.1 pilus assembly protein PilE [Burkholderia stabilis]VBB11568.1 Serogroup C1,putative major pilin subunit,Tfp pilus assembly protein PilE,prepilin-type N-terminal cleavage/methylation domain [Burkholderia stabilis]HDR9495417.1 prepilin-type N-terminal cleavage/methylation domain-containing protein [Burkholderia stabilis]HDR9526611.1 prepilin-type N-terminal cleavage/methylation domain-containing protein [Burkholderia stabilis]HDR9534093.